MHKPDATQRITIKPSNSTGKDATPKPDGTTRQHPPAPTSPSKTTSPPESPLATQQSMKSGSANAPSSNGRKQKGNASEKSRNGKSKNEENAKKPNAAESWKKKPNAAESWKKCGKPKLQSKNLWINMVGLSLQTACRSL